MAVTEKTPSRWLIETLQNVVLINSEPLGEGEYDVLEDRLGAVKPKKPVKRFVKPTVSEIREYCTERNNNVDPEKFYDFYESKGWKIGKNTMKDWKAAVRTWEEKRPKSKLNLKERKIDA